MSMFAFTAMRRWALAMSDLGCRERLVLKVSIPQAIPWEPVKISVNALATLRLDGRCLVERSQPDAWPEAPGNDTPPCHPHGFSASRGTQAVRRAGAHPVWLAPRASSPSWSRRFPGLVGYRMPRRRCWRDALRHAHDSLARVRRPLYPAQAGSARSGGNQVGGHTLVSWSTVVQMGARK